MNEKKPDSADPRKQELDRLLSEQEELSEKAAEESRKSLKINAQRVNQARLLRRSLPILPAEIDFETLNDSIGRANAYHHEALQRHYDLNTIYETTSSTSSTVTITAINRSIDIEPDSAELITLRGLYLDASGSIDELGDEITKKLARLNLDQATEGKKPSELLAESISSYNLPVTKSNPVASSLLPLRSCADAILANLMRIRPKQEKISGQGSGKNRAKVVSIGRQLKMPFLGDERITFWADRWDDLHDELSDAKSKDYSWEKWVGILKKTLIFINGFLGGLDSSKFGASS